jgi:hypothetical protein
MPNSFNGLQAHRRRDTIFIALPVETRTRIAGGCQCSYCKTHLDEVPMWDTMAVSVNTKENHTWTVHYPDLGKRAAV